MTPPNIINRIILIERLSLISIIYVYLTRKSNDEPRYIFEDSLIKWLGKKFKVFRSFLNKTITKIEYADLPGSYFTAEEEGYSTAVDSIFEKHENNIYFKTMMAFCQDPIYSLVIKKELFNRYVQHRVKTFTIIKYLSENDLGKLIIFLPQDNMKIQDHLSQRLRVSKAYWIPRWISILNSIIDWTQTLVFLILFPILMVLICARYLFRGIELKHKKIQYNFAFDIYNSGINFEKNPNEFFFIFDFKKIHPKETLQVIRNRFEISENGEKTRDFFNKSKYPYVEMESIQVPLNLFVKRICGKFLVGGFTAYVRYMFFSNWRRIYAIPSLAVMKMTIDAEIFYNKYDVCVFIARDEYSAFHIVRTLVARSFGRATIGFSHGDDCHHTAALNYLVFDRYALWGDFYRNHLKKALQYSKTEIIGAGPYGADKTFSLQKRHQIPEKYKKIREKYKFIGIFGSSFSPDLYITRELTLQFYRTVLDLTEEYVDYLRIIKPKGREFDDPDFLKIISGRERVIVEERLWTYRLLACLDLVICINVSSVGLEGLMAGKKVFYFDVSENRNHHVYMHYCNNLVAYDEKTLKENLKKYIVDGIYCSPECIRQIQSNHGSSFDGNVLTRLRRICINQLSEVQRKNLK